MRIRNTLLAVGIIISISIALAIKIDFTQNISGYTAERNNTRVKELIREQLTTSGTGATVQTNSRPIITAIPTRAYLNVPFTPQAPFANWDVHDESCEEAALLQVQYFLSGDALTPERADADIRDMIEWQKKHMNGHHDLYADDMKTFISGYYGYSPDDIQIIRHANLQDIKQEIAAGNPIIAPITGDLLKNPWYHYPGYHMLTIIGYTEDRIITNDVGTKRGKDFSYEYERFLTALRDASGDIIVIKPNSTSHSSVASQSASDNTGDTTHLNSDQ